MSEKQAKAARKEAKAADILYTMTIEVMKDGGFALEVPQGANIPLTLDVLMRCSQKVLGTFIQTLNKQRAAGTPSIVPSGVIPEGLLRRGQ